MKIENRDEVERLVIGLIDSLYPCHECIILTGSTLDPHYHRPQSDIDVVVVSKEFTGVTSHVLRHCGEVVDITRVGFFQLHDLMIENSYNSAGILLSMLSTGEILRDRCGLAATLRTYSRRLLAEGNLSYRRDAYTLVRSLVKLRKHLGKRLDRTFDFFLMCDAARLFVQCHLFLGDGGRCVQDTFRTVKHIDQTDGSRRFAESIARICRDAYRRNDKKPIACYADYYIAALKRPRNDSYRPTRFIVNIGLPAERHDDAMKIIHRRICGDSQLSTPYLYGYSTGRDNIFREGIVLIFDACSPGFDRHAVLHRIYEILAADSVEASSIDIVDDRYRRRRMPDAGVERRIDALLRGICNMERRGGGRVSVGLLVSVMVRAAARLGIGRQRRGRIMTLLAIAARPRDIITNNMSRRQILESNARFKEEMETYADRNIDCEPIDDAELSALCDDLSSAVDRNMAADPIMSHLFAAVGLEQTASDNCFVALVASALDLLSPADKSACRMAIGAV